MDENRFFFPTISRWYTELGGGNSNIFVYFSSRTWGEVIQVDEEHIFQMGWFNHQLDDLKWSLPIFNGWFGWKNHYLSETSRYFLGVWKPCIYLGEIIQFDLSIFFNRVGQPPTSFSRKVRAIVLGKLQWPFWSLLGGFPQMPVKRDFGGDPPTQCSFTQIVGY